MVKYALTLLVVLGMNKKTSGANTAQYDRSILQKMYPGFGKDFVIFPGENGEDVYGYFGIVNGSFDGGRNLDGINIFSHDVTKDVSFTLYNRENPDGWVITHAKDLPRHMDRNKKLKGVTHGWLSHGKSNTCLRIKDSYLNKSDVNVIIMDWSPISGNGFYPIPMAATHDVGEYYGKLLDYLVVHLGVKPQDIHLIGHSLGAHVSGFAGRQLKNGKIGRLTALDPALPGFDIGLVKGGRLNSSDAAFVDVIHTCSGYLGIKDPIGHVDIYPNGGGPPQPGCHILKLVEACSHGRSWQLFAKSITLEEPYMATHCMAFSYLEQKTCQGDGIPVGEDTPSNARGIYYLTTSDKDMYFL